MARCLLLAILMYSSNEIQVQALLPPKLTVNPSMITETDSVTLNCQTPPSVSVHQCFFITVKPETSKGFSCLKTLTGTELLVMTHQSSPAEVEVKCFYTVMYGDVNAPSPHSDTSSITVLNQKPQMSLQHFPGEYVVFICSLPGSANNDTRCNLYFGDDLVASTTIWKQRSSTSKQWFCPFTLTVDDLLRRLHSVQQSDASCDYRLGSDPNALSPRSDGYKLTYIVEKESISLPSKSTSTMTTGLTFSTPHASVTAKVTSDNRIYTAESRNSGFISTSQTSVKPASEVTVSTPYTSTSVTPVMPTSEVTVSTLYTSTSVTPVMPTSDVTFSLPYTSTSVTPVRPASETVTAIFSTAISNTTTQTSEHETWMWKLVVIVAGFGVTVGVILLVLALVCTRRTEKPSYKRKQANITDEVICTRNLDHGGMVPAGDGEAYSVIMSLPGVDCPSGPEKLYRQVPQNEDTDVYHVYSTISEEPPAPTLKDMVYSTLQAH